MNDAELVKSRLDIVEVIGGYVELKKAGKDYKGVSPFRQERTPSFFVSPDKQIWHDFGSNEGGDLISFIMQIEGMSFPESLEMLASRAGVTLSRQPQLKGQGEKKQRLYELMELAWRFYHLQLSKSPEGLKYIKDKRGLKSDIIKHYKLGYAPDSWSAFSDQASKNGFTNQELKAAGLIAQRDGSEHSYDMFRDRIMFPVFDAQGRAIGFSGRILGDQKAAKYINSPETAIYHKSQAIFGLFQAKSAMRQLQSVIIVEGHLDVLSLVQAGLCNVVAISGTAITIDQLKILMRLAPTIQLCLDQDAAGQVAVEKAIRLGLELDGRIEVISFDDAKDPDEFIKKHPLGWKDLRPVYGIDFLLSKYAQLFPPDSGSNRKALVKAMLPIVAGLKDRVEQENYLTKIASIAGVEPTLLREELSKQVKPNIKTNTNVIQSNEAKKIVLSRAQQLENALLELVLAYPAKQFVLADLRPEDISEHNRSLVELLQKQPQTSLSQIIKALPHRENDVKILALRGEQEYSALTEHELGLEAFTQVHTVQKHIATQKKRTLSRLIASAEQAGDVAEASRLLQEYQSLVREDSGGF